MNEDRLNVLAVMLNKDVIHDISNPDKKGY